MLRKVLRAAAKVGVESVVFFRTPEGGANVVFRYCDATQQTVPFADANVLVDWLHARRSWRGVNVIERERYGNTIVQQFIIGRATR